VIVTASESKRAEPKRWRLPGWAYSRHVRCPQILLGFAVVLKDAVVLKQEQLDFPAFRRPAVRLVAGVQTFIGIQGSAKVPQATMQVKRQNVTVSIRPGEMINYVQPNLIVIMEDQREDAHGLVRV
jgi:hypothetical protein